MATTARIEDLYGVPDHVKAELVDGEIQTMSPTGDSVAYAAGEVFASLRDFARRTGKGRAFTDNAAFLVDLPNRKSFSPDAAYYIGPPAGMKFLSKAPVFAVEVRSEADYGPGAERRLARKRADYFAAAALVVWDVDVAVEMAVMVYRADSPDQPTIYRRRDIAEAEPAAPGWTMAVDDMFMD